MKSKLLKKVLGIGLTTVMVISTLTGCSGSPAVDTSTTTKEETKQSSEETKQEDAATEESAVEEASNDKPYEGVKLK
ncbi:hypothetical protein LJC58_08815, partial [Lachnospiraceae bacterium OttesenSCG-928-D06]|nr:hypothetical protein [Lachnospiraceae bacterium OttesenSCG-928-D06]